MSDKSSICVLVSGGLDSDALLAEMVGRYQHIYPLYVRQRLAWEKVELYWLRRFIGVLHERRIQPLQILELPMSDLYGSHWSVGRGRVPGSRSRDAAVYLPGRNLILTVKAAVYCAMHRIPVLAIGSLDHNPFPDASPSFFKSWARSISQGLDVPFRILAPYRSMSKTEVIRRYRSFPLSLSFSCLAPQGKRHCGRCNKCAERQKAFRAAGVEDKTQYAS